MTDGIFSEEQPEINQASKIVNSSLMLALEPYNHNPEELKRLAAKFLPFSLSCALQSSLCLKEIKVIINVYPDLKSTVLKCAIQLRDDKSSLNWAAFESPEYKEFIMSLSK